VRGDSPHVSWSGGATGQRVVSIGCHEKLTVCTNNRQRHGAPDKPLAACPTPRHVTEFCSGAEAAQWLERDWRLRTRNIWRSKRSLNQNSDSGPQDWQQPTVFQRCVALTPPRDIILNFTDDDQSIKYAGSLIAEMLRAAGHTKGRRCVPAPKTAMRSGEQLGPPPQT
jgi:hypothetical protein